MKNQGLPYSERGSAIVWVFILITLFGILTVALSKGSRTSLGNLDREESNLAASEIIGYAQNLREAVRNVRIAGCADTQINFNTTALAGLYNNTTAPTDGSCDIYGSSGGLNYSEPQNKWLDMANSSSTNYGQWFFTASSHVSGIGTEGTAGPTCTTDNECKDLIAGLPYINLNICKAINKQLGFGDSDGTPPKDNGESFAASTSVKFVGTYPSGGSQMGTATPTSYSGKMAGCIEGDTDPTAGTYHFFQVLLAR
jgi:hypothetical protein